MGDCGVTSSDNHVACNNNKKQSDLTLQTEPLSSVSACDSQSANFNLLTSSLSKEGRSLLEEKDVLLQHHHDLSNLCRDLEQHKLDMQRQHMQLAEALRNLGVSHEDSSSCRRGDKLRARKTGRDEHGMNGASVVPTSSVTTSPSGKHDIWDEELASESLDEPQMTEIPELFKSTVYSSGLPPRTIPFRSASFSQVDITSEGKYVRNPRSPITLKPTAFCLMNNSYASGSSTLPRAHGSSSTVKQQQQPEQHRHSHDHHALISASEQEHLPTSALQMSHPISYQTSCGADCVAPFHHHHLLPATISEHADSNSSSINNEFAENELEDFNNMENLHQSSSPPDMPANLQCIECRPNISQGTIAALDQTVGQTMETKPTPSLVTMESQSMECDDSFRSAASGGIGRLHFQFSNSSDFESNLMPEFEEEIDLVTDDNEKHQDNSITSEEKYSTNIPVSPPPPPPLPPPPPPPPSPVAIGNSKKVESEAGNKNLGYVRKSISGTGTDIENTQNSPMNYQSIVTNNSNAIREKETNSTPKNMENNIVPCIVRHNKPQLVRSPPLIREESIMARSSSEEGPKSDQEEERTDTIVPPSSTAMVEPVSGLDKSLGKIKKKKHVLLDLEVGGGSSISGSGGEDDADKDKHGLFRQSSGQSDESGEGDRQSDGCTSPPISGHPPGLTLHRSHLSAGNSPLTDALALASPIRRGSTSAPAITPSGAHSASNLHSTSLPQTSSVSGQSYFKGPSENDLALGGQREGDRVNSLSSPNVYRQNPPRRYSKRPLRGPYGEMLEAEMNKVVPRSNKDFDSLDFWRESKSSSPSRSTQNDSDNISGSGAARTSQQQPKFMSSMDDLNLTKQNKHSNTRSRKISANLPVTHYHTKG